VNGSKKLCFFRPFEKKRQRKKLKWTQRHWRTLDLDQKGVSIKSIKEFLGHENLSSTQIYLSGRKTKEIREEIRSKDKFFRGFADKKKDHGDKL